MSKLWLITFSSFNYAGASSHCVVKSETEDEARRIVADYIENFFYEEDSDQWYDDYGRRNEPDCWAVIDVVEEFDDTHEYWVHYQDPEQQRNFYQNVNF